MPHEEPEPLPFTEAGLTGTPIRDLHLVLEGTALAPILDEFRSELQARDLLRLNPHFYLSTEWGVPFDTVAVAIPFYLASAELTALHRERHGHVEGASAAEILRYLRHEMGHVVNYAYRLYEEPEWQRTFGLMTAPYVEEYRSTPFDRDFVWHLPGWYAQKHPDEDWAETFAVCVTPGLDWKTAYADAPLALGKLRFCEEVLERSRGRAPLQSSAVPDEDVSEIRHSINDFYAPPSVEVSFPERALDTALTALCASLGVDGSPGGASVGLSVAALLRQQETRLLEDVYRWTGHFPERTRLLLRALASRAEALSLQVPRAAEALAGPALASLVTALAMNHGTRGSYFPSRT